ncbi:hypothetical protein VQ071_12670, partial [Cohnella sp. 56]
AAIFSQPSVVSFLLFSSRTFRFTPLSQLPCAAISLFEHLSSNQHLTLIIAVRTEQVMANIEHLQTVHVPASKVYETLTTAEGLAEIWTNELIVNNELGFINEFGRGDTTKMRIEELIPNPKV